MPTNTTAMSLPLIVAFFIKNVCNFLVFKCKNALAHQDGHRLYWEGLNEEDRYYHYERKLARAYFPGINTTHTEVPGLSVGSSA